MSDRHAHPFWRGSGAWRPWLPAESARSLIMTQNGMATLIQLEDSLTERGAGSSPIRATGGTTRNDTPTPWSAGPAPTYAISIQARYGVRAEDRTDTVQVFLPRRYSGAGTCGGGPGSVDVDNLAVEPVLVQVAGRRLDPACGRHAAGSPRLEPSRAN
jgi:hypothetical protein